MNKIEIFEGLRGYMAIWVFITHALTLGGLDLDKKASIGRILVNGDLPVTVFIMLSGFVIAILMDKGESYRQYITRRALRLFPIYLVSLIASVLLLDFTLETIKSVPWQTAKNMGRINLIMQGKEYFNISFISHLFLAHGLIPNKIYPTTYTLMGQAWSLTLEWQFYLVAPFLHRLASGRLVPKYSLFATAFLILVVIFARIYMPQSSFLPNMLFFFAIGYFSRQLLKYFPKFLFPFLSIILLVEIYRSPLIDLIPHIVWIVILYLYVSENKWGKIVFANNVILNLGRCSYSFYCIHFLVLILSISLVNQFKITDSNIVYTGLLITVGFLLTTLLSNVTYRYIELPFMKLGKGIN